MCTVSFVPKASGFYVAMNRDEKLTRRGGLPPAIVNFTQRRAIFPREPNVGTWIAANDVGICFALINWHRVERERAHDTVSRGQVVRKLAGKCSRGEIAAALDELPLNRLRPFRLIAIIPSEKTVLEWRWNLDRFSTCKHAWKSHHWFSSGFDESTAERERDRVCKAARHQKSAGRLDWLRRLHRSHFPERGPFSICMHRSDAATVSYTEVAVFEQRATMRYKPGSSCSKAAMMTKTIWLAR
jgi:hypothetical protein